MKKLLPICILALSGCIYERYDDRRAAPGAPPLTRDEAERLAAAGVAEPTMVEIIEQRGARALTADDIVAIKKAGASDAVIQKMIATERKDPPEIIYVEQPVYYRPYYYGPYWYPSWGFGYSTWGRRSGLGVRVGW